MRVRILNVLKHAAFALVVLAGAGLKGYETHKENPLMGWPSLASLETEVRNWVTAAVNNNNIALDNSVLGAHPWLTWKAIRTFEESESVILPLEVKVQLVYGAIEEDWDAVGTSSDPAYNHLSSDAPTESYTTVPPLVNVSRAENHFMAVDPSTGNRYDSTTWDRYKLKDPDLPKSGIAPTTALAFAFDGNYNKCSLANALAIGFPANRRYRFVGHALHLLEDMASPPHVRNDAHVLKKSAYEQLLNGAHYPTGVLDTLVKTDPVFRVPTELGINSFEPYFTELSAWTAKSFFSEDTINKSEYNGAKFGCNTVTRTTIDYFYGDVETLAGTSHEVRLAEVYGIWFPMMRAQYASAPWMLDIIFGSDKGDWARNHGTLISKEVTEDTFDLAGARAIAYGAGVINVFYSKETYSIRGSILTATGTPVSAVPVQLKQGNTVIATKDTDGDGNFEFLDMHNGYYTVEPLSICANPLRTSFYIKCAVPDSIHFEKMTCPVPVTSSFNATPDTIQIGGTSNLTWAVTGATSLTITNDRTSVSVDATSLPLLNVSPGETTVYTLTATNSGGSSILTATVTIAAADDVKTFTLPGGVALELQAIPAGQVMMGRRNASEPGSSLGEDTQHLVTIPAFHMGTTEITQAQWRAVMTGSSGAVNPSYFLGDDLPVEQVSWSMIADPANGVSFLKRLNDQTALARAGTGLEFRLPSEAEWEYACRALPGTSTNTPRFHWGEDADLSLIGDYAWWIGNSGNTTHPVGTKAENAFHLHDMSGNVLEWCADDWHVSYDTLAGGAVPVRPDNGNPWVDSPRAWRVFRGGGWGYSDGPCRSASRSYVGPGNAYNTLGFRVVLAPVTTYTLPGNVTLDMVSIPGGTFTMGQTEIAEPTHSVTISAFSMAKFETTQAQWVALMGSNPSAFQSSVDLPVESVSYNAITAATTGFLAKLNLATKDTRPAGLEYRLPTEAEWEYACRAGSTKTYSFGDDAAQLGNYAWYDANSDTGSRRMTHPVGKKLPNAFGLFDMHGNVWEWCQDWYDNYPTPPVPQTDPPGPSSSPWAWRVLRGGSWYLGGYACRSAYRLYDGPDGKSYFFGFRVVLASPRTP